ncbi:RHS repeat protein [Spartinivicinus ruber]|uniref:RHS repeat protein n=1 Tax=Spartinivicinus ruber TaxID=2683272 RepID=UPI0013D2011D|nr:RHS repeat protein [Spartinivicinus ruber]
MKKLAPSLIITLASLANADNNRYIVHYQSAWTTQVCKSTLRLASTKEAACKIATPCILNYHIKKFPRDYARVEKIYNGIVQPHSRYYGAQTCHIGFTYKNRIGSLQEHLTTAKFYTLEKSKVPECPEDSKLCQGTQNTGSSSCSDPSTGNPVRISNGNKYQVETDIVSKIGFQRFYNSLLEEWSHSFNYKIINSIKSESVKYLARPDGKQLPIELKGDQWQTEVGSGLTVSTTTKHSAVWLVTSGQQKEYYDDQGRLIRLEKASGEVVISEWTDNQQIIKDDKNNQVTLTFDGFQRLVSVQLNQDKPVKYEYDYLSRLSKVTLASGKTRQYHYDNSQFPLALTGITDENGVRFATWTYDDQGRAISSEHAGGKEKVSLEFHDNNSTTVTNPLGKKTTYHFQSFNGVNKVVKVEGHQSANCAAANKEYTYYPTGLLKTKTDWKGNTTEYKYNDQGLQIEKTEAVGTSQARTVTTEWDVEKRLPLKSSDGKLETLYQYDEQGKLASKKQVSQPSAK